MLQVRPKGPKPSGMVWLCGCSPPPPFRNILLGYPKFFPGVLCPKHRRFSLLFFFPSAQLFSSLFPFRCTPRPGQPSQPVRQFFCVVQRGSFYSVFFPKLADFLCGSFWLLYLFWPYFGRCSLFLGNFLHSCSLVQACLCFQQLFETRQAVSCQECGKGPACGCLAPPSARTGAFPCQSCLFSLFSEPTLHALVELVARG